MIPRVLFLDHAGSMGGAELYLLDIARAFPGDFGVVVLQKGPFVEALREEGIEVEVIPAPAAMLDVQRETSFLSSLVSIPAVVATVLKVAQRLRSFDVLYANSQKALVVGGLAGMLARKPVIWNLHDILTADHFSAFNRSLAVRWSTWFVDRVITNSNATADAFEQSGGDRSKAHVVYNGIDAAPYEDVAQAEVSRLREELGLNGVPVVGVFSRLAPWKGQHVLIEALEELSDMHALLVGDTLFSSDVTYARRLRDLVSSKGLAQRVHFLGFRNDVPVLMHLVDYVAHTSVAPEPFGRVIVEGMLARKPVVATRAGGALEIVQHGETGLLVDPEDPVALQRALELLRCDTHMAEELGSSAYRHAKDQFSVSAMRENILQHVQAVVGAIHNHTVVE